MRVSEYIAKRLAEAGIQHVFMLTGGGAMFLNDALTHQAGITPVYNHHEQACAIAAEGYARISNRPGAINVTTGPGAINAMNGVFGAWTDSVPMIVISGQVKRETCITSYDLPDLRQLGDQEGPTIEMVKPITKYAATVNDANDIAKHLDRALFLATHGRPGPVWLDVPIDVQSANIDPDQLPRDTQLAVKASEQPDPSQLEAHATFILDKLANAKRPVIMAGSGVRIGDALAEFETLIRALNIPVVTAWTHDLIDSDDPLFCGRPGTIGTRAGNFTVQNADVLLVLGSRLNIRQTSYNYSAFAQHAFKIQVDVDSAELAKPTVQVDHQIHADVKALMSTLNAHLARSAFASQQHRDWLAWCKQRLQKYPTVLEKHRQFNGKINPYHFIERLFSHLNATDIVACGNATACIVPFQVAHLKKGQRLFSNSGSASMGYDLPAAMGAHFAATATRGQQARTLCLAGDGSLMLNVQELQTLASYQIPVKVIVLNNAGYLSIRTSQQNFFKRLAGAGPESGVEFPDFVKVANSFGIPACRLDSADFDNALKAFLEAPGPGLCDVILDPLQGFEPRMSSRQLEDGRIVTPPLEDMFPFLDRDELASNVLY